MTVYKVQHGTSTIEFSTLSAAQAYATAHGLSAPTSYEKSAGDTSRDEILAGIFRRQDIAHKVLAEIYSDNIAAGITDAQSDAVFAALEDVILCLKEGAFSTALYRIQQKTPSGFLTQQRLDDWEALIASYV